VRRAEERRGEERRGEEKRGEARREAQPGVESETSLIEWRGRALIALLAFVVVFGCLDCH